MGRPPCVPEPLLRKRLWVYVFDPPSAGKRTFSSDHGFKAMHRMNESQAGASGLATPQGAAAVDSPSKATVTHARHARRCTRQSAHLLTLHR
jgi:hypothetical protein